MRVLTGNTCTWLSPEGFEKIMKLRRYRDRCLLWSIRAFSSSPESFRKPSVVKPMHNNVVWYYVP